MTENICGYEKDDGVPCQRPAGWGTPSTIGHCSDHAEEYHEPRKLDEETVSALCGAARTGAFKHHCAQVAGITPRTLRNWLSRAEDHIERDLDTPLVDFYFRFRRARAAGAVEKLNDAPPEFILSASYGYTKTERREVDADVTNREAEPIDEAEADELLELYADRRR